MRFTASIHTGCHTPLSLQSRLNQKIFRPQRVWSVTASVNIDHSPVMVLQGLSEECVAGSFCLPHCLHHENEESAGETEARVDHEWRK